MHVIQAACGFYSVTRNVICIRANISIHIDRRAGPPVDNQYSSVWLRFRRDLKIRSAWPFVAQYTDERNVCRVMLKSSACCFVAASFTHSFSLQCVLSPLEGAKSDTLGLEKMK